MAGAAAMIPYFDYPWALVLAPVLAIVVGALVLVTFRRRRRRLERLGAPSLVSRLVPPLVMNLCTQPSMNAVRTAVHSCMCG